MSFFPDEFERPESSLSVILSAAKDLLAARRDPERSEG